MLSRIPKARGTWTCLSCRTTAPPPLARAYRGNISKPSQPNDADESPQEPPPPSAPKATPNIKGIRANPTYHAQNCLNRNYPNLAGAPHRIVALYDEWAALQTALRTERARHNNLSGRLRAAAPMKSVQEGDFVVMETKEALIVEAKELKAKILEVEAHEERLDKEMRELALQLPNSTHPDTPVGNDPKVIGYIQENLLPAPPETLVSSPTPPPGNSKNHVQIGTELALLDFSSAAVTSGWGWYYLTNEAVLLEQALINHALTLALSHGFKLVTPPSIIYSHIASACGFRPRDQNGEQQIYALQQPASHQGKKPEHCLAGTAEIPLAAMYANKVFTEDELPLKMVGVSRSYRAEAGARGVESKGLYRVHEFTKVEMFAFTHPDPEPAAPSESIDPTSTTTTTSSSTATEKSPSQSETIFQEMLSLQKTLLTSLNLPARILSMPTTDLGASASCKIDIEAYMPSRHPTATGPWGEVSSLSNCLDYQSRRLNTRLKVNTGEGGKTKMEFPYTLNGTAVAIPRVLMAILENGWCEKRGGVVVPEVLRKWMPGVEVIRKKH
ncbi:hypothetical protein DFH27DRAFT_556877 [Peziza echinospora]|nr:hypothetical protein DFH27DRAFT_556877 [Peziza echinospora]